MQDKGFNVTCVDKSENSKKNINEKNDKISVITSSFEDIEFNRLPTYDLIYSNFGIIFCNKSKINQVIENVKIKTNENGFFVGNFLGIDDEWNDENHSGMKFFTQNEVKGLFNDWKIWYIAEKHYIKDSSNEKDKKWHVIEIYAQK